MPKVFVEFLEGNNIFVCGKCNTHLSSLGELISKAFRGQHGTAYLFHSVYALHDAAQTSFGARKNENA